MLNRDPKFGRLLSSIVCPDKVRRRRTNQNSDIVFIELNLTHGSNLLEGDCFCRLVSVDPRMIEQYRGYIPWIRLCDHTTTISNPTYGNLEYFTQMNFEFKIHHTPSHVIGTCFWDSIRRILALRYALLQEGNSITYVCQDLLPNPEIWESIGYIGCSRPSLIWRT